jgi:hypothetical protein
MGSLARRERRPLWGILTFLLAVVVGLAMWAAANARSEATREAAIDAEFTGQTELAPLLQVRDLTSPITGDRAAELAEGIDHSITSVGPVQDVRIFSSLGRILYASDPKFVGTRPSYLRDMTFEVASGDSQTIVRDGLLQTYVPIWLSPGGDVAVAELSQPVGPIAAEATASWYRIAMIAGALMLGAIAMMVVTIRADAPRSAPVQVYAQAVPRHAPRARPATATDAPLYEQPGFRVLEEQRLEAERRASAVEQNFRAVQQRLKDALAQVKDLEGRLAMNETQNTTNGGELQALRDQLRDTSGRLHQAELDNSALRERMTLRQQELDEARRIAAEIRMRGASDDLRARLAAVDERAAEMEREIDELVADVKRTNARLHLPTFSHALAEFEGDDLEIEGDDSFEEPLIIRNTPGHATPEKVRVDRR